MFVEISQNDEIVSARTECSKESLEIMIEIDLWRRVWSAFLSKRCNLLMIGCVSSFAGRPLPGVVSRDNSEMGLFAIENRVRPSAVRIMIGGYDTAGKITNSKDPGSTGLAD